MNCFSRSLLFIALAVCMYSCKFTKAHEARLFNDSLIRINQTARANVQVWADSFELCKVSGNYTTLTGPRELMENYLRQEITEVEQMEPLGIGGEDFKKGELTLLKIQLMQVEKGFSRYEKLTKESGTDDMNAIADGIDDLIKEEETAISNLLLIQKKYAADNGFPLGEKKLI
ncbi:hypothetical protein [Flavipsychrobacter stenotrophus]|nr:hypothetical protein [Flavipsychrobacter stenotrophus]